MEIGISFFVTLRLTEKNNPHTFYLLMMDNWLIESDIYVNINNFFLLRWFIDAMSII